ncbi:MAG: hypothetical protein AVDCRST_MAG37-2224 [uncultured Rubrobacteraceae bacterium]|uniref:Uncharacterized protein n=1 Tax=uncultured Rubrobacteraceae bacterium TaxID=349277 RepID=A0A6J4QTA6_9ACTN|nr:MAG: hypothetical protein AVDCRST_MAG37-2224 [uncultured Rubrobacteraceae bacterium]
MREVARWLWARPDRLALTSTVLVTANVVAMSLAPRALALTLQTASITGFLLVLLLVFGIGRGPS